jgi:plasmid stabilization system protein ParE
MRFRFSRRAEADLEEEISAYIGRDDPARAVSFVASCANIAAGWWRFLDRPLCGPS